jgi:hypothetical protein
MIHPLLAIGAREIGFALRGQAKWSACGRASPLAYPTESGLLGFLANGFGRDGVRLTPIFFQPWCRCDPALEILTDLLIKLRYSGLQFRYEVPALGELSADISDKQDLERQGDLTTAIVGCNVWIFSQNSKRMLTVRCTTGPEYSYVQIGRRTLL